MTREGEVRWLTRVLRDETGSAYVLIAVAALTLLLANSPLGPLLNSLVNSGGVWAGHEITLSTVASELVLCVFFFVAGLELSHELTDGELADWRAAVAPLAAAVGGMAGAGLTYFAVSGGDAGWPVPLATDLPFALAALALAGKGLPLAVKSFLLALAIFDDLLSVLLIGLGFGGRFNWLWLAASAAFVILWTLLLREPHFNRPAAAATALLSVVCALQGGLHPTLVAALLGVLATRHSEPLRRAFQPWSSGFALPLFAFTVLATPLALSWSIVLSPDTYWLSVSRIIGKTLGIALVAVVLQRLLRPAQPLSTRHLLIVGGAASIGFSVSLLFIEVLDVAPTAREALLTSAVTRLLSRPDRSVR